MMQFIKNNWLKILVGVVVIAVSIYVLSQIKKNALPNNSQPDINIETQETQGTSSPATEPSSPAPAGKIDIGTLTTPFFEERDIISVNEAYSLNANNKYWGFAHPGIDFMSKKDIRVQAVTSGTIDKVETAKTDGQMGWHTGFCINRGSDAACYNLETFSSNQAVGDKQKAGVQVKDGDEVKQGDFLATLIYAGEGAHIDFGIITGGSRVCPEPYFTPSAKESVLKLIHKDHPSWQMCAD